MNSLCARLRLYQKKNGFTVEDVYLKLRAADIPVSYPSVSNWLRNGNEPSQMYRKQIETFLNNQEDSSNDKKRGVN